MRAGQDRGGGGQHVVRLVAEDGDRCRGYPRNARDNQRVLDQRRALLLVDPSHQFAHHIPRRILLRYGFDAGVIPMTDRISSSRLGKAHKPESGTGVRTMTGLTTTISSVASSF